MPCLKPDGDCTDVSGCADCGCDDTGGCPEPVLPKCQSISIPPGTYAYATIIVDSNGCISSISEGEVPVYTPDDCCGEGGDGTEGPPGPRGPKGDSGSAATVTVDPNITTGTGAAWTVENIGTTANAVFKFTAPADTADDCCPDGFTGSVCGLQTENGVVKTLPPGIVTGIEAQLTGEKAAYASFVIGLNNSTATPCDLVATLNLDAFYYHIKQYIDDQILAVTQRLDSIQYGVSINGNTATNSGSADVIITVKKGDGTVVSTITVPAGGSATLPNTTGATYYVYKGTTLLGSYSTVA